MKIFRMLRRFVVAAWRKFRKGVMAPDTETVAGATMGTGLGRLVIWTSLGIVFISSGLLGSALWMGAMVLFEVWLLVHLFQDLATLVALETITAPSSNGALVGVPAAAS